MSNATTPPGSDDRGVSELVGVVVLFGIVAAGSALILLSGAAVTEEVRAESRVTAAESALVEMDGTVQSLAATRGDDAGPVDLGPVDPTSAEIRDTGQLRIQVNGNPACTATMDLSALEYRDDAGTTVAYEAGAVWKRTESGVVVEKAPELGFREGALQLQVVTLEGAVDDEEMTVDYNRTESIDETESVRDALFSETSCRRPDTVTVEVESDYHAGWQSHLESTLPASATVTTTGPETVRAEVDLDATYDVVDFTDSSMPGEVVSTGSGDAVHLDGVAESRTFAGTVTYLGGENGRFGTDTVEEPVTVVEPVNATYAETVPVELTGEVTVTVENVQWEWDNETVEVDGEAQPPLEVAFVLDESGSMSGGKLADATRATRGFLDVMKDDQGHRVALVGYDTYTTRDRCERYYDEDAGEYRWDCDPDVQLYEPFTGDQSAVAGSLSDLEAGGFTPIPQAIERSAAQFEADSDRKQILVLVTDGKDTSRDRDPVATAREAIPEGVTVYTVGVGDEVNADVLREVAAAGANDSRYISVDSASELDGVFERIAKNETTREKVIPRKVRTTTNETVTVELSRTGSDRVSVTRVVGANESARVGDEVTVSGEVRARDEATVSTVTVERTIEGVNETRTERVEKSVNVTLSGRNATTIAGSVELGENRTGTERRDRPVDVVTWPATSLSLDNESTTVDLWPGRNLNARAGRLRTGAVANVWLGGDDRATFAPAFRECTGHVRLDGEITDDGTAYNETSCSTYGGPLDRSATVHVFANGSTIAVPESASWQTDLESMLTVDGTQYYQRTGGDLVAANLDSNQVLVVVEADDGDGRDANNVVLIMEVGESTAEASSEYLVDVEVTAVSAESDDEDDS